MMALMMASAMAMSTMRLTVSPAFSARNDSTGRASPNSAGRLEAPSRMAVSGTTSATTVMTQLRMTALAMERVAFLVSSEK